MSKIHKITFILIGVIPLVLGLVLLGTAGIKGFNGQGGKDAPLFQIVAYLSIIVIVGGLLSILVAVKPNWLIGLLAGILLILPGIFMALINPVYGGPVIVFGVLAIVMSRRIRASKTG